MSNATADRVTLPYDGGSHKKVLPVAATAVIRAGTMVAQLNSGAGLVAGSTASSGPCVGVSTHAQTGGVADGTTRCEVFYSARFAFPNASAPHACSETTPMYQTVFMADDHTISNDSQGGTLQPAGQFIGMEPDGHVVVFIPAGLSPLEATGGAGMVGIADAGNFTAQTTVEGALQEIYQDLESTKGFIALSITEGFLVAGTPMAAFTDNAASQPGIDVTNTKSTGVRWNDAATQVAVWMPAAPLPADFDATHAPVLKVLAAKTGATVGDATTFTVACHQQVVGALLDAGADLGGVTGAMTGNAPTKTVQEVSLALAAAAAGPGTLSLSINPTNGTLGTDDVTVFRAWIEYTRKLRTS